MALARVLPALTSALLLLFLGVRAALVDLKSVLSWLVRLLYTRPIPFGSLEGSCVAQGVATTLPTWLARRLGGPVKVPRSRFTLGSVGKDFVLDAFRLVSRTGRGRLRFGCVFEAGH